MKTNLFNKIMPLWLFFVAVACCAQELPIVVIIPSYNNIEWYERNLNSILDQNYENFRIIYVDDCSTDGTPQAVRALINKRKAGHRVRLMCNSERRGALANIYRAVHSCKDYEIIVNFDGDDWAKDTMVLARVNQAYANPNTWMTYGQYEEFPRGKLGLCKEIPQSIVQMNAFREYDWAASHLRTFYAGLFKKIKLEDLIDSGDFFDVTWDRAFMLPMLEMAGGRHTFIRDILYVYNQATPLNDFKKKLLRQIHYEKLIHSKPKYKKIESFSSAASGGNTDLIIYSYDHPIHLLMLLETISRYCSGVGVVSVVYRTSDEAHKHGYDTVRELFPSVNWIRFGVDRELQISMLSCLAKSPNAYVCLAHDGMLVKDFLPFEQCTRLLAQTSAHAFYCALGKNIVQTAGINRPQQVPPATCLEEGVFAWQFKDGEFDWRSPYTLNMAVYKKEVVVEMLQSSNFRTIAEFEYLWNKTKWDSSQVGLFNDESKAVCVAYADSADELRLLNEGLKIDTVPLFRIGNTQSTIAVRLNPVQR